VSVIFSPIGDCAVNREIRNLWLLFKGTGLRVPRTAAAEALRRCLNNPQGTEFLDFQYVERLVSPRLRGKPRNTQPLVAFQSTGLRVPRTAAAEALRLCLNNPQGTEFLDFQYVERLVSPRLRGKPRNTQPLVAFQRYGFARSAHRCRGGVKALP